MSTFDLSVQFFLQLAVILTACRIAGWCMTRLGQTAVVGEMIAGMLLGPSFFGYFWPQAQGEFFSAATRPILFSCAQLGLALYMFSVGLDFRFDLMRTRLRSALAISLSGILVPFAFGCGIAWLMLGHGGFFPTGVTAMQAVPYLGAALAITAFPTLARMIAERGLNGTVVGTLALAAGAIGDAAAWGVLALVLASLGSDGWIAVTAIGGGGLFVLVLFTAGRWLLKRIVALAERGPGGMKAAMGWTMVMLMGAAWFTDTIRLYAVFGAFFLGAAVPRGTFATKLHEAVEPLTTSLLLPLFFVYSGLNTRFDLVTGYSLWLVTLGVLAAAIVSKAVTCYAAARACGESHRESMGVGALMNARGLMELIILNIGLERGIITPTLFTIFVLMAVVTTLMTIPMFNRVYGAATPQNPRPAV